MSVVGGVGIGASGVVGRGCQNGGSSDPRQEDSARVLLALVTFAARSAATTADLIDFELDDGALVAVAGLERSLPEPALHDHAVPAGQGLGDVLGGVAPDGAAHEQGVPVLPLAGLAVEGPRGGRDGEVGDGRAGRGEAQLGVPRSGCLPRS